MRVCRLPGPKTHKPQRFASRSFERTDQNTDPEWAKLQKRADYAFRLNQDNVTVENEIKNFNKKQPPPNIRAGILLTPFTADPPPLLLAGVEVKARSADDVEAFVQLSVFSTSILTKYSQLSGQDPLPIPGFIVKGHDWDVYLSWPREGSIYVHGPVQIEKTDTWTYHGIFSLLELIKRITKYGAEEYWPWVRTVLQNY